MTYNNIHISIRELLDREKIKFITSDRITRPIYTKSSCGDNNFLIITAPYKFEAMRIVTEFDKEFSINNIKKSYCIVGDAIKEITKENFIALFTSNFENNNIDKDFENNLLFMYLGLLSTNQSTLYKDYIDLCLNISKVRSSINVEAYKLSGDKKYLKKS